MRKSFLLEPTTTKNASDQRPNTWIEFSIPLNDARLHKCVNFWTDGLFTIWIWSFLEFKSFSTVLELFLLYRQSKNISSMALYGFINSFLKLEKHNKFDQPHDGLVNICELCIEFMKNFRLKLLKIDWKAMDDSAEQIAEKINRIVVFKALKILFFFLFFAASVKCYQFSHWMPFSPF